MKSLFVLTSKITNKNSFKKYNDKYIKVGDEKS